MSIPRTTSRLIARGLTAIAGLAAISAAPTITDPHVVLAGADAGSTISPSGLAAGSTNSSPHQCTAAGLAISISGESAVDCSGITTGSS